MTSTVISLQEGYSEGGVAPTLVRLIRSPDPIPLAKRPFAIDCSTHGDPFDALANLSGMSAADVVKQVGTEVWRRLAQHPAVRTALDNAAQAHDRRSIVLEIEAPDAEPVPWETLYHPDGAFLALGERWPMTRVVDQGCAPYSDSRSLEWPLRILAILAADDPDPALSVDAKPELRALRDAIDAAGAELCELHILASDPEIVKVATVAGIDSTLVPGTTQELVDRIRVIEPQILHIFCHGSLRERPHLRVGTRATRENGQPPLLVQPDDLAKVKDSLLLVTLNACRGGAVPEKLHSLVYDAVAQGIPAAIGMREDIGPLEARTFTRTFYEHAIRQVEARAVPGSTTEFDWAEVIHRARTALRDLHHGLPETVAGQAKEWTLPILYVRPVPLRVQSVALGASGEPAAEEPAVDLGELRVLLEARKHLRPETPPDARRLLDARIFELAERLGLDLASEEKPSPPHIHSTSA